MSLVLLPRADQEKVPVDQKQRLALMHLVIEVRANTIGKLDRAELR